MVVVLLGGCTSLKPISALVELEHVSHPLVGWPVNHDPEAGLSQVSGLLRWDLNGVLIEQGLGYNLDPQGFYGPRLTYTGRISKEFRFSGR